MKTNKSYSKRLRVTRNGKIMARVPGHNHFNAKQTGTQRQRHKRNVSLTFKNLDKSRFLPR